MDSEKESRMQGDHLDSKQEATDLLEWTSDFSLLDERSDDMDEFDHNPYNQNHPTIKMERIPPVLCMSTDDKPRLRWTPELHEHFVECAAQLGGPFGATPKHIMRKMNVDGLTILHVKSHLQKYRATVLMQCNELAHTPSPSQKHPSTPHEEPALQSTAEGTEMLPGQMPMQDSQFLQSQVGMSLQIQEEAQEKYLESLMKHACEFCAPQRASFKHQKCEISRQAPFPSPPCISANQSDMQSHYSQLQGSLGIEEMQKSYDEICTPQTTQVGSSKFSQVPSPTLPCISAEQTTLPSGSPLQNNQHIPFGLTDSFPGSPLFGLWPEVDHYSFHEMDP